MFIYCGNNNNILKHFKYSFLIPSKAKSLLMTRVILINITDK